MLNQLKDYIAAQLRENSTWRGLVDVLIGVGIFHLMRYLPANMPSEAVSSIGLLALGFIGKGSLAVTMPDTTKTGQAKKVEQALEHLDKQPGTDA